MKSFLIEEAKRAKKAGLTKRQFIIAESILIFIEFLKAAYIIGSIIFLFVIFG